MSAAANSDPRTVPMPSSISFQMPRKRSSLCILSLTILLVCFFAAKGLALEKPYPCIRESSLISVHEGSLFLPLGHTYSFLGDAISKVPVSLPENEREAALLRYPDKKFQMLLSAREILSNIMSSTTEPAVTGVPTEPVSAISR